MPYYPEDQSDDNLNNIRWSNVCAQCGRQLYLYFDRESKLTYIACPTPGHEGIAKEYKPPREDYLSNIRRSIELEEKVGLQKAQTAVGIPKQGQLTKSQAIEILKLVYPGVPDEEIIRCAILCQDFGLHPLMKEVYIIPFGQGDKRTWATVLGINATRKMMAQRGTFSYLDNTPRIMTEDEQKIIFGEVDAKNIVAITKLRTRKGEEAPGYGRWPKDKEPYGTDKGNTKANMAFIRSERNAFGRLFTDALPQGVEIVDEAYVELPDIGKVDRATGEILEENVIEGEVVEVPPETEEKLKELWPEAPESKQETKTEEKDHTPITAAKLKSLQALLSENKMGGVDLQKWCNADPRNWGIEKSTALESWQYDEIVKAIEQGQA